MLSLTSVGSRQLSASKAPVPTHCKQRAHVTAQIGPRVHRCVLDFAPAPHRQKLRTRTLQSPVSVRASAQTEQSVTPVTRNGFEWTTNVSRHGNVYFAIDETSQACKASLSDSSAEPTVALFFATSSYSVEFDRIIPVLRSKVPSLQHIIGCTVCFNSPSIA